MIEEKTRLVQLLDDYMSGERPHGRHRLRAHDPDLQHFSLIASTYTDGHGTGAVGVIGPTRMRYSRAINAVDSLSQRHQPRWSKLTSLRRSMRHTSVARQPPA